MIKACLMTSTRYMTGVGANDTLWSNNQGMGLVDLGRAFDGVPRILVDQTQVLRRRGQTYVVTGTIASSTAPFRVALVWTDPPGPTTGNAYVNNLDLQVTVNGTTYLRQRLHRRELGRGRRRRREEQRRVRVPAGRNDGRVHGHGRRDEHRGRRRPGQRRHDRPGLRARRSTTERRAQAVTINAQPQNQTAARGLR